MLQYRSGQSIHRSLGWVKVLIVQFLEECLNKFKAAVWLLTKCVTAHKQVFQRGIYIQYTLDFLFATA